MAGTAVTQAIVAIGEDASIAGPVNGDADAERQIRLMPGDRFECVKDDSGDWMVWDHTSGAPAKLGGVELRGQDRHRAEIARDILRRIFRAGPDKTRSDPSDA
ncbi:hypothetical protein [Mesorhizobium loti]|uniref:hypothetical protein n=1 Tax=Rhizobium loti TaxID=381 RepID=UPI0012BC5F8B|nr:hypothetical protein [Mesorhizobium loti]